MGKEKKKKKSDDDARPSIDPDVLKGVWSIFLVALAVLSILSFFDKAGLVGNLTAQFLETAFGWGKYVAPAVLLGMAAVFVLSWGRDNSKIILLGGGLFFSTILGFLALSNGEEPMARGGYWGFVILWPLLNFLGTIGAFVALTALLFVSVLLGFNISLGKIVAQIREQRAVRQDSEEEGAQQNESEGGMGERPEFTVKTLGEEATENERKKLQEKLEKAPEGMRPNEGDGSPQKTPEGLSDFPKGAFAAQLSSFSLPPLELLESESGKPTSGDIVANANIIKRTFQNFGIDVEMGEVNVGPTVTQYTMKPAEGIKLARITTLHNDLSLALAAHPIRMEAPIPGRSLVGIEIPNKATTWVRLRDLVRNEQFTKTGGLSLAIGRDVAGTPVYTNLAKMPHMLIAGSTGSGKTIALNTLILSLLYKHTPDYLRLILIDPKRVEFSVYEDIPHLLAPVITNNDKAINALKWAVNEMDRRFDVLAAAKARDIEAYNSDKKVIEEGGPLPYVVIVIDELADLMASKGKEVEAVIVRIAQMARAVGIHLVLATQRPSVEVITGLIKANITARMAFQVASQVDSRTILDMAGAEKLLGNGDMLFLSPDRSKPRRVQGAYIRDVEVKKVGDFLRKQKVDVPDSGVEIKGIDAPGPTQGTQTIDFEAIGAGDADDDLYEEAKEVVIKSQKASASLLQRRLRIGYARAARMLDILEERSVIGPGEGAKPRDVYLTADDIDTEKFLDEAEEGEEDL